MGTQLRDSSQDVGYKYLYELDIQTWALISNVNYKKNFSSLISGISKLYRFEDSTFIYSCSKWEGGICYFPFANINFKTHATNLTYLLGLIRIMELTPAELESEGQYWYLRFLT